MYLNSEIEGCEPSSPKQVLLQTVKLLVLEEAGKRLLLLLSVLFTMLILIKLEWVLMWQ